MRKARVLLLCFDPAILVNGNTSEFIFKVKRNHASSSTKAKQHDDKTLILAISVTKV